MAAARALLVALLRCLAAGTTAVAPFTYTFSPNGLLQELNFTAGGATASSDNLIRSSRSPGALSDWDERGRYGAPYVQHFGHSSSSKGLAWTIRSKHISQPGSRGARG
jgi:hypothetical protein